MAIQQGAGDDKGERVFGSTWPTRIAMSRWPADDRGLHELARLDGNTSPRTTRAIGGQLTVAMAMTRLSAEGARIATSTMAKMNDGMVWKNSLTRMSTSSTMPP